MEFRRWRNTQTSAEEATLLMAVEEKRAVVKLFRSGYLLEQLGRRALEGVSVLRAWRRVRSWCGFSIYIFKRRKVHLSQCDCDVKEGIRGSGVVDILVCYLTREMISSVLSPTGGVACSCREKSVSSRNQSFQTLLASSEMRESLTTSCEPEGGNRNRNKPMGTSSEMHRTTKHLARKGHRGREHAKLQCEEESNTCTARTTSGQWG